MKKHYDITIAGRVQGVGFRFETQNNARLMGLNGYVKNLPDNRRVFIEAEGEEEMLDQFIKWCHDGPPGAHVNHVEYSEDKLKGYSSFDIKH